jgi:hypothetical protein
MKMKLLQVILIGAGMLAPVTMTISAANRVAQETTTALTVKLTQRNGASRVVKLEGVGCTVSICSRTHIQGTADSIPFEALHAIQDSTPNRVLLVLKNGVRQPIQLVKDFRVLYFQNELGRSEKLDLAEVRSLEFLPKQD